MIIKRLYLRAILSSLNHKTTIDAAQHKIELVDQGFLIDGTVFTPMSNCIEALVEQSDKIEHNDNKIGQPVSELKDNIEAQPSLVKSVKKRKVG